MGIGRLEHLEQVVTEIEEVRLAQVERTGKPARATRRQDQSKLMDRTMSQAQAFSNSRYAIKAPPVVLEPAVTVKVSHPALPAPARPSELGGVIRKCVECKHETVVGKGVYAWTCAQCQTQLIEREGVVKLKPRGESAPMAPVVPAKGGYGFMPNGTSPTVACGRCGEHTPLFGIGKVVIGRFFKLCKGCKRPEHTCGCRIDYGHRWVLSKTVVHGCVGCVAEYTSARVRGEDFLRPGNATSSRATTAIASARTDTTLRAKYGLI